ncbi:DUF1360 domain-containing protein [Bacillus shivajii]|uniref:DUF1360 domain-containing protein n=1 Tax=Bacillus shivajii TaxID=1983719 RepID=UPI001CFA39E7|nr:DUF1360 domain-containing protein [Bacillus shivajii]UCZ51940.1 DUF1360 domain-containing protein [Bacillus shivajii]
MGITLLEFLLYSLAVFRFSHLIVYDKITTVIRKPFIQLEELTNENGELETVYIIAENGWKKWIGELLSCHWCIGIWGAAFIYIGYIMFPLTFSFIITVFAAAGVAAIIETIVIQ